MTSKFEVVASPFLPPPPTRDSYQTGRRNSVCKLPLLKRHATIHVQLIVNWKSLSHPCRIPCMSRRTGPLEEQGIHGKASLPPKQGTKAYRISRTKPVCRSQWLPIMIQGFEGKPVGPSKSCCHAGTENAISYHPDLRRYEPKIYRQARTTSLSIPYMVPCRNMELSLSLWGVLQKRCLESIAPPDCTPQMCLHRRNPGHQSTCCLIRTATLHERAAWNCYLYVPV